MSERPRRQFTAKTFDFGEEQHVFDVNQYVLAPWEKDLLVAQVVKHLPSNYYKIRYLVDGHETEIKGDKLSADPEEALLEERVESETVEDTIEYLSNERSNASETEPTPSTSAESATPVRTTTPDFNSPSSSSLRIRNTNKKRKSKNAPVKDNNAIDDALTYLESRSDWGSAMLYMCPPEVSVLTDEDSGDDEEIEGMVKNNLNNLGRNQLNAKYELLFTTCSDEVERVTNIVTEEKMPQPKKNKRRKSS